MTIIRLTHNSISFYWYQLRSNDRIYTFQCRRMLVNCINFVEINKQSFLTNQAEKVSENCGPPPSNNFDLEVGQRSRSRHGAIWKGLSQGSCMPNINALSLILQKIWARLKFLWRTEGRTNEFLCPRFRERPGTINRPHLFLWIIWVVDINKSIFCHQ